MTSTERDSPVSRFCSRERWSAATDRTFRQLPFDRSSIRARISAIEKSRSRVCLIKASRLRSACDFPRMKPKYQSKRDKALQWTGRGRTPLLIREEKKGTKLKK